MIAVLQRVSRAEVRVDSSRVGIVGPGLLVLLGVDREDTAHDAEWLSAKCAHLRIFPDSEGRMNVVSHSFQPQPCPSAGS